MSISEILRRTVVGACLVGLFVAPGLIAGAVWGPTATVWPYIAGLIVFVCWTAGALVAEFR